MPMSPELSHLNAYLQRAKFADPSVWLQRGLNPSQPDVIARMESVVNEVCSAAIQTHTSGASPQGTARAMGAALRKWKAHEFDTEEREFICSEVASMAKILGLRMGSQLNLWLYGRLLGTLVNLGR